MRIIVLKRHVKFPLSCILFGIVSYLLFISINCYTRDCSSQVESRPRPPIPIKPMMPTTAAPMTSVTTTTSVTIKSVKETWKSDGTLWSSEEEIAYPLAFSIIIRYNFPFAVRLLRLIYRPQNVYCIHIHKRYSDRAIAEFKRHIADLLVHPKGGHIIFVPSHNRIDEVEGRFSALNATLTSIRTLLNYTDRLKWRYYFNLDEGSLPLRTNWELVRAIKAMNGSNSVEKEGSERHWWVTSFVFENLINFKWMRGSSAVGLSREFVHFLFSNSDASMFIRALPWANTIKPDQVFFSTLSHYPRYKAPGGCLDNHYKDPGDSRTWNMARYYYKKDLGCKTKRSDGDLCYLGIGDLSELMTRPEFFANTFSPRIEPEAYEFIEQWVITKNWLEWNSNRLDSSFNVTYYAELYCSKSHI